MSEFVRDPNHWLRRMSPREWLNASMNELKHAEGAYRTQNLRGGLAGCKRAAGMALNAVLLFEPNDAWGRTYVEHVTALAREQGVPAAVREACLELLQAKP